MLHEVAKRKQGNAELPCPPEKRAAANFSRACRIFRRGITAQNLTSKNRPYPAENELKNAKNYAVIFSSRMITDVVKRMLHEVPSGSKANAELPYPPEKKSASDFFEGV